MLLSFLSHNTTYTQKKVNASDFIYFILLSIITEVWRDIIIYNII